jgi:hypothetical protein
MRGIYEIAEWLLASEEGLCFMKLEGEVKKVKFALSTSVTITSQKENWMR